MSLWGNNSDRESGVKALTYFFNRSNFNWNGGLKEESIDAFIKMLDAKNKSFIDGLGLGVNLVEISDDRLARAMSRLADGTKGKLPTRLSAFSMAISAELQTTRWEDVINVATETVVDATSMVGDNVMAVGFDLKEKLPLYIGLAIVSYIGFNVVTGKVAKAFKPKKKSAYKRLMEKVNGQA